VVDFYGRGWHIIDMNMKLWRIVAATFIGLILGAAFHEMAPGLCAPRNADGSHICPFCTLIYTLIVVSTLLVIIPVVLNRQISCSRPTLFSYNSRTPDIAWLVRAPPLVPA
jgi:hypothetical protein